MGRSRIELCVDILKVMAEGNRKPTRIMYKANLSWPKLGECLSFLGERGLIKSEVENQGVRYEITERGMEALDYFGKMESAFRNPSSLSWVKNSSSAIHFHHRTLENAIRKKRERVDCL